MNTHARRGEAAYSFTELLITIVIAGIAFAAMVPVFVAAQQTGPKDKYRTTATNIAQDRIERIRQLPYSVVTTDRLLNPPSGSGLSSQLVWGNVTLDGKTYHVAPTVTDVDATTRRVTVTVTWHEPPNSTERTITLQTDIFRQLPGPQILSVKMSPSPVLSTVYNADGTVTTRSYIGTVPPTGVKITAVVQPAQALDVGRVKFAVVDMSGATSPVIQFVSTPDYGTTNSFSFYWAAGTALKDGLYRVSVVAYSTSTTAFPAEQGNTKENDLWIEQSTPGGAQGVSALGGLVDPLRVNLLWSTSGLPSDLNHFEVWRQPSTGGEWVLVGDNVRTYGFVDTTGLTAGAAYKYVVRIVDNFGKAAAPETLPYVTSAPALALTGAGSPPARPKDLKLSFAGGTMTVTWSPPMSAGDVAGYHVYRSSLLDHSDATLVAAVAGGGTSYAARDDLKWGTTYFYTVKSFNAGGAESPVAFPVVGTVDAAGWAQYVTPAAPEYQLYVQVRNIPSRKSVTVRVTETKTGVEVTGSPFSLSTSSSSKTLSLPYGVYTVTMALGSDVRSTSAMLTGDPTKMVYVTFII